MQQHSKKLMGVVLALAVSATSTVLVGGPAQAAPQPKPIRIQGLVTAADGTPLSGILVSSWVEESGTWVVDDTARTDASGKYNVGKLETGTYRVGFQDDVNGIYVAEFYDDVATVQEARDLTLSGGKYTVPTAAVLEGRGAVAGAVTDSSDAPLSGADVTVYVQRGEVWQTFAATTTAADGTYAFNALPAGSYKVGFAAASMVTEFWDNQPTLADAAPVTVTNDATTPVNAELAPVAPPVDPPVDPVPVTPAPTTPAPTTPAPTTTTPAAPGTTTTTTTPAPAAVAVLKKPRIKGVAKVGQRLRVTGGTWSPGTVKRKIQWLANGKRIKGATKNRLRLSSKLAGKRISVRVVASAPGRTPVTLTTRKTKKVAAA